MPKTSSKASRAAYRRCSETCQKVRAEISQAIERELEDNGIDLPSITISRLTDAAFDAALAYGTEPLRDALIDCEDELLEAQEALSTAESDRDSYRQEAAHWEDKAYELEADVRALESELDTARSS